MSTIQLYIPSVTDAARRIVSAYFKEDYDMLQEIKVYLGNNNVAGAIAGTASEFHNAAVELTRNGFYEYAYALIEIGIQRHPRDTDLLGDLLAYGLHCRSIKELQQWYDALSNVHKRFWTWRAYQFSFDYLMARLPYSDTDEEVSLMEHEIKCIIESFKDNFKFLNDKSDCEKAYMMEFEFYSSKGEETLAEQALIEATNKLVKCAQCALKYADRCFERGDYGETIKFATIAAHIKEDQPSISLGYTNYILAMSLEQVARQRNALNNANDLGDIYSAYYSAYTYLSSEKGREHLINSVTHQVKVLEFVTGTKSGIDFSALDSKEYSLMKILQGISSKQEETE